MNLVPEHIDEAIKHMPGRTEEEIWSFYNQDSWRYSGDKHIIFDLYHKMIKERPYIKEILEGIFGTVPDNYRIQQINKNPWSTRETNFTFYFERNASLTAYLHKPERLALLLKHNVNIQCPGNGDYSFSITMYDEKMVKEPVDNTPKEYDPLKKPLKKKNI